MAEIHDLIATRGKKAAIEAGWPADLVRAAGIYLADKDTGPERVNDFDTPGFGI
jgi:hypothetical protein